MPICQVCTYMIACSSLYRHLLLSFEFQDQPLRRWLRRRMMELSLKRRSWSPSKFQKRISTLKILSRGIKKSFFLDKSFSVSWEILKSFLVFLLRFANPGIVRPYLFMLRTYSKNTPHTNHCVVRMLHRLAVDLKMDALLFQLSVFHLFNKILSDPAAEAYKVRSPP